MKIDWKSFFISGALLLAALLPVIFIGESYKYGDYNIFLLLLVCIMLALAQLSRWKAGKKILYGLFVVELLVPVCTSLYSIQLNEPDLAPLHLFSIIISPLCLAASACLFYLLEGRLEKLNLRFIAVTFIILAYSFFVSGPLRNFLETSGNTWPDSYYVAFKIFNAVRENWLAVVLPCAIYYGASLKFLDIKTVRKVNTSLLISLAIILEGVFMPCLVMIYVLNDLCP